MGLFRAQRQYERVIWIHAGPHKTASTYLIKGLRNNRRGLAAQGVHLARDSEAESKLLIDQDWQAFDQRVRQLPQGTQQYLISREVLHFRVVSPKYFQPLLKIAHQHGFKLGLIFLIRDQADWINSMYCHGIRRFYPRKSFWNYCKKTMQKDVHLGMQYCQKFNEISGTPEIKKCFIPLSRHASTPDPLMALTEALHWTKPKGGWQSVPSDQSNLQPGKKAIWLARSCRQILEDLNLSPDILHHKGLVIRDIALNKQWHLDRYYGFSPKQYKATRDFYALSNDRFAKEYWQCNWQSLFPDRQLNNREVYRGPATDDEQMFMQEILMTAMQRMGLPEQHEKAVQQAFASRCKRQRGL